MTLELKFIKPFDYRSNLIGLAKQVGVRFFRPSLESEPGVHVANGSHAILYFDNTERKIWILLKSRSVL